MKATRVKQVWAVGSGKGGVGKSLISSTLAINLSKLGLKVTAIDLDLGGANLHTALGIPIPEKTLGDFLQSRSSHLSECLTATPLYNLEIISGAQDPLFVTQTTKEKKLELLNSIRSLDSDYVILDLGAGTHSSTVQFFLAADVKIVAFIPEPSSIEGAYRFIKAIYYQNLLYSPELSPIHEILRVGMNPKNSAKLKTPADVCHEVSTHHPQTLPKLVEQLRQFHIHLILNQTRTQNDTELGDAVKNVCKKYFGIPVNYLGALDYDPLVWQAVRRKKSAVIEYPSSRLALNSEQITRNLIGLKPHAI
ncbi:MinD/ParA family protein [bacterium]|nr:MinD/ParA family protein [bacterium]